MTKRLRVALIFGGQSGEHDVSVVSARSVSGAMDRERYEVVPMAIDRDGRWADSETARRVLEGSGDRTDRVVPFTGAHRLDPRLLEEDLDVAFPVLHGPYGEDGTIQGLFELIGLAYVGSGVTASAVCMDKIVAKRLLVQGGFATPDWLELEATSWQRDATALTSHCLELGLPLFVKPPCLGSSLGISKVSEPGQLPAAIAEALSHDRRVIVEKGIDGREIEVAVLGNLEPRASVPGEVVPGHDFYDYADKYLSDDCQLLAPAPLEAEQRSVAQDLAVRTFHHLGCEGMARVDLFLAGDGSFRVSEVNTIPGFTPISMYPRLWGLSGLAYPELVDELIRLARQRKNRLTP